MTTPTNSDDFFKTMGATAPGPPKPRPRSTAANLARPPPAAAVGAASPSTAPTIGGVNAKPRPAAPPAGVTQRPRPTAAAVGAPASASASAGRTPTQPRPAARGGAGRGTTTAGRQPSSAGRTSSTTAGGRGTMAGRTRTTRPVTGSRPTAAGVPSASRPIASSAATAGVGFYGAGTTTPSSTHLSSSTGTTPTSNPYASAAPSASSSSDAWFSGGSAQPQPQQQQHQQPSAMNPYATTRQVQPQQQPQQQDMWQQASNSNSNMNQWQQPSLMQSTPSQPQQQQTQTMGSNFFLAGAMTSDDSAGDNTMSNANNKPVYDYNDIDNEPPLLEELGINIDHIWTKTKAVILPYRKLTGGVIHMDPNMIVEDADLAGPLMFALALGGELLITGKLHFGYIYGFGLFGCLTMTLILNLMAPKEAISVWTVTSILGYSLLPVNILALVKIVIVNIIRLETFGRILALMAVAWSTMASVRLLEVGCGMRDQRYLIGYPIALLYSAFVLMTIF